MSGDLVSLRLLLVGAVDGAADLWRSAASRAHIPVDFDATGPSSAKIVLSQGGVDICVLDGAMTPADVASVVKSARRQAPATLVFASLPPERARPDKVDGVVPVPANATDAGRLVALCIRAKMRTQVLLAADSESLRSIVRKILGACRFELDVHEATDADDTLTRLSGSGFDLIFLDQNISLLNGADLTQGIGRVCPDARIVVMSTGMMRTAAGGPHTSKTMAVLKKPFYPADVDAVLERYFGFMEPK